MTAYALEAAAPDSESATATQVRSHGPFHVDVLQGRQKLEFRALVILWAVLTLAFWIWWLRPAHVLRPSLYVMTSLALAWISLSPLYFLVVSWRAVKPNPAIPIDPSLRLAMVVTKAPSEPFNVVRKTLEAMLAQSLPHDTWLADEDPSPETLAWCAQHGVKVSCRKGVAEYHRPTWPRRTRCKEGNLAFFYDHFGYEQYDVVVQLDADHVPEPEYLEHMVRPFADPAIGYASAPSICDQNASGSWSARARLFHEAFLHSILQAGYSAGLAPLCFGSHYAVRTAALKQIGGLGPELAEDHSTSLMMNAGGWRGAHALDAEAHGDGPDTFSDMLTQEFQWSRSLQTLLLTLTPQLYRNLPLRLAAQFLFCQSIYTVIALYFSASIILPLLALGFDENLANVTYVEFLAFSAPPELTLIFIISRFAAWRMGRPVRTKVLSWEGAIYPIARWPWVLIGLVTAIADVAAGRKAEFRVTPKGGASRSLLPARVLIPYLTLSALCSIAAISLSVSQASGFYVFALLNSIVYLGVVLVALRMHRVDSASSHTLALVKQQPALAYSVAAVAALAGVAFVIRFPEGFDAFLYGFS